MDLDLRQFDILSELDDEQLDSLRDVAIKRHYNSGSTIIEKDAEGTSMFLICEGRVRIELPDTGKGEIELDTLQDGDFFGEIALLDGQPRSAVARALDDSTLLEVARGPFLTMIQAKPDIALKILGVMARRVRGSDQRVLDLADAVVREAGPRLDDALSSRLEAAKLIYERTEANAERVVAHVDRTWKSLVWIGSVVVVGASIIGAIAATMGIQKLDDVRARVEQTVADLEAKREQADTEVRLISEARKAAVDGQIARAVAIDIARIRRELGLDGEMAQYAQLAPFFDKAEQQLLAMIVGPDVETSGATPPAAEVTIEAAASYLDLVQSQNFVPSPDKLLRITDALIQVLARPDPDWRTRLKTQQILNRYAAHSPHALGDRLALRLSQPWAGDSSGQQDLAEVVFDLDATNTHARRILGAAMRQGRSKWSRLGAAVRLARIDDDRAWQTIGLSLHSLDEAFTAAYLVGTEITAGQRLQIEDLCRARNHLNENRPIELIRTKLQAQLEQGRRPDANPYLSRQSGRLHAALLSLGECRPRS